MLSLTREEGLAVKIGKLFNKENALTNVGALRSKISHSALMHISILMLILVIAATIRLLPLQWGVQLSEFDPHVHYRLTKHMVDNGFFAWTSWTDTMSWYPSGQNIGTAIYPGLATSAAFLYQIANALNLAPGPILSSELYHPLTADPVFNFCVFFPVIMATFTVLVMYFVAKDIGGKKVGLFAALFLALSSPFISRTSLGFFDDESVGILGILLFVFFFLRSIDSERSIKSTLAYSVAGGLSLGYLFASWGAARYPLGVTLIFVLAMLVLRRYSTKLLISYGTTFAVSLLIAINVPKLGVGFLTEPTVLAVAGMFLVLGTIEFSRRIADSKNKMFFIVGFLAAIVVLFVALSSLGLVGDLGRKFVSVIFPGERAGIGGAQQLIQSVQENQLSTWASFYYDLGIGFFFVPLGLFFTLQNPTNRNIYLAIFGVTSIYFANSFTRLSLIMAPAACILWAVALVQVVTPFVTILREEPKSSKRKMRLRPRVGKEFSAGFIILLFVLLTVTFVLPGGEMADSGTSYPRVVNRANSPTTIATSSLPFRMQIPDWLNTLNYMRTNLGSDTVVASWWDYGYWITAVGNKTTLIDNGTTNATQIGMVGEMFMSNETEALKILAEYDVTHVLVFTTFGKSSSSDTIYDSGYGDEGKWGWMARIAELDDESFGNRTLGQDWFDTNADGGLSEDELIDNELGQSTVLYKLMHYARDMAANGQSDVELEHFEEEYFSQETGGIGWFSTSDGYFGEMVALYKVVYD